MNSWKVARLAQIPIGIATLGVGMYDITRGGSTASAARGVSLSKICSDNDPDLCQAIGIRS